MYFLPEQIITYIHDSANIAETVHQIFIQTNAMTIYNSHESFFFFFFFLQEVLTFKIIFSLYALLLLKQN